MRNLLWSLTHKNYLSPRIREDVYGNIRQSNLIPLVQQSVLPLWLWLSCLRRLGVDVWTRNGSLARLVQSAVSTITVPLFFGDATILVPRLQ
jgi:hypothetical protein